MLNKKDDLFIGEFPGCVVFADKTVEERGDYKQLARVSHAGNISYVEDESKVPEWAREAVKRQAEWKKKEFDKWAKNEIKCRPVSFYARMLDSMTLEELIEWCDREIDSASRMGVNESIEDKCRKMLPIYRRHR